MVPQTGSGPTAAGRPVPEPALTRDGTNPWPLAPSVGATVLQRPSTVRAPSPASLLFPASCPSRRISRHRIDAWHLNGSKPEWCEVQDFRSDFPPRRGLPPSSDVRHQNAAQRRRHATTELASVVGGASLSQRKSLSKPLTSCHSQQARARHTTPDRFGECLRCATEMPHRTTCRDSSRRSASTQEGGTHERRETVALPSAMVKDVVFHWRPVAGKVVRL
jgi:hypothetical protein